MLNTVLWAHLFKEKFQNVKISVWSIFSNFHTPQSPVFTLQSAIAVFIKIISALKLLIPFSFGINEYHWLVSASTIINVQQCNNKDIYVYFYSVSHVLLIKMIIFIPCLSVGVSCSAIPLVKLTVNNIKEKNINTFEFKIYLLFMPVIFPNFLLLLWLLFFKKKEKKPMHQYLI